MTKYDLRQRKAIINNLNDFLLNEYVNIECFNDNVIYSIFIESIKQSKNKTELKKVFINICNDYLGRSYLIGDMLYILIKDYIKHYL
jgi:hypothetical protein